MIFLLFLAVLTRAYLLVNHSADFFFGEEVMSQSTFGLMGYHILQGKPMVYMYGQGYMGPFESILACFFYPVFGKGILSLQLAVVSIFLGFVVSTYLLLKKLFGGRVSLIACVFLILAPVFFTRMSFYAMGGYNDTLMFGSLSLLLFLRAFERPDVPGRLFWAALVAGVGFWTHNLVIFYFLPLAFFVLFGSEFWRRIRPSIDFKSVFLLRGLSLHPALKIAVFAVHSAFLVYLAWNVISIFSGHRVWSMGPVDIETFSLPFRFKEIKKWILVFLVEGLTLVWFSGNLRRLFSRVKPALLGFVLGTSPMIYFALIDGEGYRQVHASSFIQWKDFPDAFYRIFYHGIAGTFFGVDKNPWLWIPFIFTMGLFAAFVFLNLKPLGSFFSMKALKHPPEVFVVVMTAFVIVVCLVNNIGITAPRYMLPIFVTIYVGVSWMIIRLWDNRGRALAVALCLLLIGSNVFANATYYRNIQSQKPLMSEYSSILSLVEAKGFRGGYAHCDMGYPMTFMAEEKIKIASYRAWHRIEEYHPFCDALDKVFYIFSSADSIIDDFRASLDSHGVSYTSQMVGRFIIFFIDRSPVSEKGIIPAET